MSIIDFDRVRSKKTITRAIGRVISVKDFNLRLHIYHRAFRKCSSRGVILLLQNFIHVDSKISGNLSRLTYILIKDSSVISEIHRKPRLLVACSDGYLYVYDINQNGGECNLLKQHKVCYHQVEYQIIIMTLALCSGYSRTSRRNTSNDSYRILTLQKIHLNMFKSHIYLILDQ